MTFQSFDATTRPEDGPPRLAKLRAAMERAGLSAFIVPRADAHQGEYVAPCDERLAWLTGFTGSAGFAVVLAGEAAVFVDGRYTVQVRAQVDTTHFTPVAWPKTTLNAWVTEKLCSGARVGFDPWLHTAEQVESFTKAFAAKEIEAVPGENLVDGIWTDRPPRPAAPLSIYPDDLAGATLAEKIDAVAGDLSEAGDDGLLMSLPDGIAWLLNIRGGDIPRIPIAHAFAVVHRDGTVDLFTDATVDPAVSAHFAERVRLHVYSDIVAFLESSSGKIRTDPASVPEKLRSVLESRPNGETIVGKDPTVLHKARKTAAEIAATAEAHLRDGAAMAEFLSWLDDEAPAGRLTEIDVAQKLEACRRSSNALQDISFDTISGSGPNGAIVHYRVTRETNRTISPGELLLVDSGGQYLDGTTDITRTVAVGPPGIEERTAFTRVLQGMIAISRARWPRGLTGRDLDPLARAPLWMAGQDYDHGTGHGVGVYLSVHEGPQSLSRRSKVPLEPGMILSNEPGYYREGAFGIRIENLVVVEEAPALPGGDDRDQLAFRTLTFVPIDRHLIDVEELSRAERSWINGYHAEVNRLISPRVSDSTKSWLEAATRPL